jgi:D-glycero-alpha-D-manno-heptose-7-phosphate kinase
MIITQAPMRISLFGGGTDVPEYFMHHGGQVLSFSIDKFSYVTLRFLPPYFNHTIRLTYSKLETCSNIADIKHPLIRVALEDNNLNNIELHHDSDVPGKSGLGSSSSFGVAMALAISAFKHQSCEPRRLASKVINWERNILKEPGGFQDQIAASYGGINIIKLMTNGHFDVFPLPVSPSYLSNLLARMLLVYIPIERFSAHYSVANLISSSEVVSKLHLLKQSVHIGQQYLIEGNIDQLAALLHDCWCIKRSFSEVSNSAIDDIYDRALNAGALGGKLLGAGGGGFMLLVTKEGALNSVKEALKPCITVPFNIEYTGARILHLSYQ